MPGEQERQRDIAALEENARALGRTLKSILPPGVVYVLFLTEAGPGGWLTYVSNGSRETVVATLQEFISKAKNRGILPPGERQ